MTGLTRQSLERMLSPLFVCPDCNGQGKREHAIWPKIKFDIADAPKIVDELAADYQPPRVEVRQCEMCRGTGRA